jgi:hypothetical protein
LRDDGDLSDFIKCLYSLAVSFLFGVIPNIAGKDDESIFDLVFIKVLMDSSPSTARLSPQMTQFIAVVSLVFGVATAFGEANFQSVFWSDLIHEFPGFVVSFREQRDCGLKG